MAQEQANDLMDIAALMEPAFKAIDEVLIPESSGGRVAHLVLVGCGRVLLPLVARLKELEARVQELEKRAA